MIDYAQTGGCRWRVILEYFCDAQGFERCGTGGNCLNPLEAMREAQGSAPDEIEPPRRPSRQPRFGHGDTAQIRRGPRSIDDGQTGRGTVFRWNDPDIHGGS
ncbi:RecQ family zinc-binding domain-containing protein [Paraburkholderia sp. HD33-4]|uniref:RecQ family zinc-binding domain-containing protein n=1 Tax=Paraburkholderia sp. HD33-4 TaxID=2883242 RepID=UPI001F22B8E8|nr:RecQ family zinc-binding domain-containing protein [Paraburkholderia sp. HD33-4]